MGWWGLSSAELKRQLLRLLEEDEEFRYAVAGVIGYREVLEELRELRRKSLEHDKRFEAIEKKLLEHDKRFEALMREVQELKKKSLEHDKRFEAIERKLLEHDEKFVKVVEEIKRLNEEIRRLYEKMVEHEERLRGVEKGLSVLGLVVGALAESTYCRFVWEDLREEILSAGERIIRRMRGYIVDGHEVDLLVETDRSVYVVEVKVKPRHEDVGRLLARAELVARRYPGKRLVPVLAGALIGREVEEYARSKGVRVYAY